MTSTAQSMSTINLFSFILFFSTAVASAENNKEIKEVRKESSTTEKSISKRDVYKTTYKGKLVYYHTSICCDIPSILVDAKGKLICYPSGGFISVDSKCPDFVFDRSKSEKIDGLPEYLLKKGENK